jgi:flagellar operon protein
LNPMSSQVKFSNHAIDRMVNRGIQFTKEDLGRLNEAVDRAAAKGSKDSLILMNDSALIVSVKNKTVVTVMDKNALKENVFTNIDSTIVM